MIQDYAQLHNHLTKSPLGGSTVDVYRSQLAANHHLPLVTSLDLDHINTKLMVLGENMVDQVGNLLTTLVNHVESSVQDASLLLFTGTNIAGGAMYFVRFFPEYELLPPYVQGDSRLQTLHLGKIMGGFGFEPRYLGSRYGSTPLVKITGVYQTLDDLLSHK